MADQKVVPTGPQGAVRVSEDYKTPVRASGENPDPRDNTPTAEQIEERQNRNNPQGVKRDKDGIPQYGGGGQKLKFQRDYWPTEQPENKIDPRDIDPATGRPRVPLVHREHRIRAGEVASVPSDEAKDLLETGVAKQHKE